MYLWVGAGETPNELVAELGLDSKFAEQAQAEDWLSACYEDLSAAGIEAVSLYEEDRLVYGPMSLLEG